MMKAKVWCLAIVLVLLSTAACAAKEALAPAPQAASPTPKVEAAAPAPVAAATAKIAWEKELEQVRAGAIKEGKVVVYMTGGSEIRAAITSGFRGKYGIPVETVSGTGREVSEKLLSERRAGLYFVDVYQGGTTTPTTVLKPAGVLDPLEPALILSELTDPAVIEKIWWGGKLLWVDPDHKILAFMAQPLTWAVINTDLVKPEEMTSFRDLLNPKWKGKILMFDPTMTGAGGKLFSATATQIMGMDYWREFAKQEPMFFRDHRLMVEWVARGKYAIAISAKPDVVQEFIKVGMPLMYRTPKEGLALNAGSGGLALVNRPPHPNAARLFINWLLSNEGVMLWSKAFDGQSARLDIPTDFVSPEKRRDPQAKYFWADTEDNLLKEVELYKIAADIFAPFLKR